MEFKEYPFSELLINIVDNRGKTCPVVENGMPLIATNCIKNESLYPVYEKLRYISDKTYKNWFRGHPEPGDIIFVCKGSPGRVAWTPNPVPFCIAQDMVAIRADETKVYPKYLFALLRSQATQNQILNMHVGTLIPHFKKGDFKNLYLTIPSDLEYQEKVGEIYFQFCEMIENNTQTNQTLEQIAQAIFKSWFVDFEPVRAKMAVLEAGGTAEQAELAAMSAISGKTEEQLLQLKAEQPEADAHNCMDAGGRATQGAVAEGSANVAGGRMPGATYAELAQTAALFPAAMVDSKLGEIPEGWNTLPLDKIAHYQNGLALQKFRPKNENEFLPVVKIAHLKKGFADGEEKASPDIKPECIIDDGDVVFSWSGSLVVDIWCGGKAALNQHLFKATSETYPKWFYHYFTKHHLAEFQRIAADKAVTMGHIKREHLASAKCAIPTDEIVSKGSELIGSLLEKQIEQRLETNTLTETRDALLPKLLSGDLPITNTEVA